MRGVCECALKSPLILGRHYDEENKMIAGRQPDSGIRPSGMRGGLYGNVMRVGVQIATKLETVDTPVNVFSLIMRAP